MPMPLKAIMANKDRRIPIPNAYALKSDDGLKMKNTETGLKSFL
jgi:hypothetical protein